MNQIPFTRSMIAVLMSVLLSGAVMAKTFDTLSDVNKSDLVKTKNETTDSLNTIKDKTMDLANEAKNTAVEAKDELMDFAAGAKSEVIDAARDVKNETTDLVTGTKEATTNFAKKIENKQDGMSNNLRDNRIKDSGESSSFSQYAGDILVTTKVKAALLADSAVPSTNITVETTDAIVVLGGSVKTQAESMRADLITKEIEGVKSVENNITIKP